MPAFNLEHEHMRVAEMFRAGQEREDVVESVVTNLKTFILEREQLPSHFDLQVDKQKVTQQGYEHREDGDLSHSFKKSEEAAENSYIERRYALETAGYEEVKERFFIYPPGSTILLFSPPPDEPIPGYPGHSMAYLYHILPDSQGDPNKRSIKAMAWVNHFTLEEQAAILNQLAPEEKIEANEKSILLNPIGAHGSEQTTIGFHMLWETIKRKYQEKPRPDKFRLPPIEFMESVLLHGDKLWQQKQFVTIATMRQNLAQRIANGERGEKLNKDFDIYLNYSHDFLHIDTSKPIGRDDGLLHEQMISPKGGVVFDGFRHLSYAPVAVDTSCGKSFGFGTYDEAAVSTATYSVELPVGPHVLGERKLKCKSCPLCSTPDIIATIANGKITCPSCKKSAPYEC